MLFYIWSLLTVQAFNFLTISNLQYFFISMSNNVIKNIFFEITPLKSIFYRKDTYLYTKIFFSQKVYSFNLIYNTWLKWFTINAIKQKNILVREIIVFHGIHKRHINDCKYIIKLLINQTDYQIIIDAVFMVKKHVYYNW